MINCIIIEDEPLAMQRLEQYVHRCAGLNLVACFNNSEKGFDFLKNQQIDVVFVDIQMNQMTGIEIIKNFDHLPKKNKKQTQFVITTAFSEYAVKGFELNAVDYLLKPYTFERFEKAVKKVELALVKVKSENQYLNIPSGRSTERVAIQDIIYIEGMRDYRRIHTADKRIMTLLTFTELEKMLQDSTVIRIHKSHMLNTEKVTKTESQLLWIGELIFRISATYKHHI